QVEVDALGLLGALLAELDGGVLDVRAGLDLLGGLDGGGQLGEQAPAAGGARGGLLAAPARAQHQHQDQDNRRQPTASRHGRTSVALSPRAGMVATRPGPGAAAGTRELSGRAGAPWAGPGPARR